MGLTIASIGFIHARRQAHIARTQAARSDQVAQFLKDILQAAGMPDESKLVGLDRLFDDSLIQYADNRSEKARLLRLRGTLSARAGHWEEAAADCIKATELALDGGDYSFDSAIILLKQDQEERYRQVCHAYLQRVSEKRDFISADMAAKVSLLMPVEHADFELACELADFAATETEPAWHLACVRLGKALAEYRRGRFDSACDWAQRAISSEGATPRYQAAAFFIRSLSFAGLGQLDASRTAIRRGEERLTQTPDAFSGVFGDTWCDWAIAEILRLEAVEVLQKSAPATQP